MAPAVRGSGSAGSPSTTNQTVTTSASAVAGDLILVVINVNNTSSGVHPTPSISGYTSLGASTASVWSRTTLLGKIAGGSEGSSYTVTGFTGADAKYVAVVILSSVGASLPSTIVTTPDASSDTTWSIPAITTVGANSMDMAIVGYGGNVSQNSGGTLSAWGGSLTELIDNNVDGGGSNFFAGLGIATATRASAGTQAATSVTAGVGDVSAAIRLEILDAGGGGGATLPLLNATYRII